MSIPAVLILFAHKDWMVLEWIFNRDFFLRRSSQCLNVLGIIIESKIVVHRQFFGIKKGMRTDKNQQGVLII